MTKQKDNTGFIAIIATLIIVFVLIIISILASYFLVFKSPKTVFTNYLKDKYEDISSLQDNNMNISYNISYNLNINDNNKIKTLNDISINGVYINDKTEKLKETSINVDYKNNSLLNIDEVYNKNSSFYKTTDKYIKTPYKYSDSDILTFVNEIKQILIGSFKESYFSKSEEKIIIDNQEKKVTKNTLNLNEKNQKDIIANIIKKTSSNNKIKNLLSIYFKIDKNDFSNKVKELANNITLVNDFKINIYTYSITNDRVAISLEYTYEDENYLIMITESNVEIFKNNESIAISNINKTSDITTINIQSDDISLNFKMNIKEEKNKIVIPNDYISEYQSIINEEIFKKFITDFTK